MRKVSFHEKGWSLMVDKANVLGDSTATALQALAAGLQRKDLIELALRDWIGWRFEHRMRLASIFASPEDYWWFAMLGRLDEDFFMIDYVLADVDGFNQEEVSQFIKAAQVNHSRFDYQNVLLGFVSESPHHLKTLPVPPTIPGLRIEYVPLLLQLKETPPLSELGTGGESIFFYEQGDTLGSGANAVGTNRKVSDARTVPPSAVPPPP